MKKLLLILITFCIISCVEDYTYKEIDSIDVDVIVTEVYTAKYSKVKGYFYYKIGNNNIKMEVDNGSSGYHYKRYNISKGDTLPKVRIKIYQKYRNNNKDGFVTSDINVDYLIVKN